MCGRVRTPSGKVVSRGEPVEVLLDPDLHKHTGTFSGHVREETFDQKWADKCVTGILPATHYWEQGVPFEYPANTAIEIAVLTLPVMEHRAGDVLILTREAESEIERTVWNRHPVAVNMASLK